MVTVEQLLFDYMTVVRANGQSAIDAVGQEGPDDPEEITWEVIEVYENLPNTTPYDLDSIWPLARLVAQMAITICHQKVSAI